MKAFLRNALCVLCALSVSSCISKGDYWDTPVKSTLATVAIAPFAIVVTPVLAVWTRVARIGGEPYTEDMEGLKAFKGNFLQGRYYRTKYVQCSMPFGKMEDIYIFDGSQHYKRCDGDHVNNCSYSKYRHNGDNVYWINYYEYDSSIDQFAFGPQGTRYNVFEVASEEATQHKTYVLMIKLSGECYKEALVRFSD